MAARLELRHKGVNQKNLSKITKRETAVLPRFGADDALERWAFCGETCFAIGRVRLLRIHRATDPIL
jgi:hypothetical protein